MKRFVLISTLLFAVAFATALLAQEQASVPARAPATAGTVSVSFNAAVLQTAEAQKELGALVRPAKAGMFSGKQDQAPPR